MQVPQRIKKLFHEYWIPAVYVIVSIAAFTIIKDNYHHFLSIKIDKLIWLFAANMGFLIFYCTAWGYAMMLMSGRRASFLEGTALSCFHQFSFLSLGKGALASTTTIIKERYQTSYISSLSYMCLLTSFFIFFNSIWGILTLIVLDLYESYIGAGFVFLLGLSSSFLFVNPPLKLVHKINKVLKKIIPFYYYIAIVILKIMKIVTHFRFLKSTKNYIFFFLMNVMISLNMIWRYQFAYEALNFDIGFWKSSLISLVTSNILCFVAITPGALAVKESIDTFFGNFLAIPVESTLTATILDRLVNIVCLIILNIFAGYELFKTK